MLHPSIKSTFKFYKNIHTLCCSSLWLDYISLFLYSVAIQFDFYEQKNVSRGDSVSLLSVSFRRHLMLPSCSSVTLIRKATLGSCCPFTHNEFMESQTFLVRLNWTHTRKSSYSAPRRLEELFQSATGK